MNGGQIVQYQKLLPERDLSFLLPEKQRAPLTMAVITTIFLGITPLALIFLLQLLPLNNQLQILAYNITAFCLYLNVLLSVLVLAGLAIYYVTFKE